MNGSVHLPVDLTQYCRTSSPILIRFSAFNGTRRTRTVSRRSCKTRRGIFDLARLNVLICCDLIEVEV